MSTARLGKATEVAKKGGGVPKGTVLVNVSVAGPHCTQII